MPNKFAMCVRQPVGLCGLITPWNFPMAIPSWKLIPALVCGNTVVIKPAEDTPLSTYNLVAACEEAGVPPGVVNLVTGYGETAGAAITEHPSLRLISFTGSTETGRTVAIACAERNAICSLEMGGKNAIIVMEDADVDLAVEGAVWGAFGTSGQRCTASSRLLVHEEVVGEFVDKLAARARNLRVGNGLEPGAQMGPCVSERQRETVARYVEIGKNEGARLVCGGETCTEGDLGVSFLFAHLVCAGGRRHRLLCREELFRSVTTVTPYQSSEEGVRTATAVAYRLSGSVYTS